MALTEWTGKCERLCAEVFASRGLKAAMQELGRPKGSILAKMARMRVTSGDDKNPHRQERKYYAEDVADILELMECGVDQSVIAEKYNTTKKIIQTMVNRAKNNGFDAYPLRENK